MPRCKNCKEKFERRYFNQKFCLETNCVKAFSEHVKEQNWKKKKAKMQRDLQTLSELLKLAQVVFNRFIRMRDQNQPCISCGKKLRENNIDAGHYWSAGGHSNVRFDEDNVHAQCSRPCNKDLHGDLLNYQIGIQRRIGADRLIELNGRAHKGRKYSKDEVRDIIDLYKQKIKDLT